jgi:2-dehydropantoate 2-reductase
MNITVIGAGAIGGWIAAKLALANAGHRVNILARRETLASIRANGLRLRLSDSEGEHERVAHVDASNDASLFGIQDIVVIAVKAPSLRNAVANIAPLMDQNTILISAMNGVPTWFFARTDRALSGTPLASIDPTSEIATAMPSKQVIGCVVHAACSVDAPGVIRHKFGNKLILGEAVGGDSARLQTLATVLNQAGLDAIASPDIQRDIWFKLWGNMTMNPVSAITGATGDKILGDDLVRSFCSAVMLEAKTIGAKIGIEISDAPDERHAVTAKLGAFKTSMLQDVEASKMIELDALVGAVREIGHKVGVATPYTDALLGLTRLMAKTRGLY